MSPNTPPPPPPPPQPYPTQPYAPAPYGGQAYPAPPYYAQPVYAVPVMAAVPGQNTFSGLKWLRYATILAIVFNVLSAVSGLIAFIALQSVGGGIAGLQTLLSTLTIVLAVSVLGGVLGLISFILGMIGYYNVHQGKTEFGEPHVQSVRKSTTFFVMACVAYLANIVAAIILSFNTMMGGVGGLNPAAVANSFLISGTVAGVIGIFYIYAAGMTMQLILAKLTTAAGRGYRSLFMILSIAGGVGELVVGIVVGLQVANALQGGLGTGGFTSLSGLTGAASVVALVSVVTLFLYFRQINSAEQGARNMIASGQFNPDAGTTPLAPPGPV